MKRLLLFAFLVSLGLSGITQIIETRSRLIKSIPNVAVDDAIANPVQSANPSVNTKGVLENDLGMTRYDAQTNGSVANRIIVFPDGTIGAVWTRGMNETAFADRGTGYNYFNGSAWGAAPTSRIETKRTGWPAYAAFGANGEINIAHQSATTGLVKCVRTNKGTGSWTQVDIPKPVDASGVTWPRIITNGPNNNYVHLLVLTGPTGNGGTVWHGLDGALVYYRSLDGGNTWDKQGIQLPGLDSDHYDAFSGDEYAWGAPHGNTIYFCVGGPYTDTFIMKSDDNGDTWTKIPILTNAHCKIPSGTTYLPPWRSSDGSMACEMDNNGVIHFVSGIGGGSVSGGSKFITLYLNGLIYWNTTMPMLQDSLDLNVLEANGQLAGWYEDGPNPGDTLNTLTSYRIGLTSMPQISIDAANNIYIIYSGVVWQNPSPDGINYRHIWARAKFHNDADWSTPPMDLNDGILYIGFEFVFASMAKNLQGDKLRMVYQTANQPGTAVGTSGSIPYHDNTIQYREIPLSIFPPAPLTALFSATPLSGNAPLSVQFTDQSLGSPTSYLWNFGDPTSGNLNTSTLENPVHVYNSPGYYSVTLTVYKETNSNTLTKTNYINVITPADHFVPVWTGNPLNPMSIAVTEATVNGQDLVAGDEIGIFDGSICVGAYQLNAPIDPLNPPFIVTSKDDPSTPAVDGYIEGHSIIYKLWKNNEGLEINNVIHTFPYDPLYVFENFTQNETAVVALFGFTSITQNTSLITGWNMFSFNVLPSNMNMLDILQPLVGSGQLIKVVDEAGHIIQHFPWGWVNNIGDMSITEGYYIKVASSCTLSTTGTPIISPTAIPLITGWNMIGYPGQSQQDAIAVLQPLITSGVLIKVIDEAGNIVQHFPWGWVNTIGNLKPGEGYYIKVATACSLIISNLKGVVKEPIVVASPAHFLLPVQGNPYQPMSVALSLNSRVTESILAGDEIGVFDGERCVGAIRFDGNAVSYIVIPTYADDPETQDSEGFTEGNPIIFRFWNENEGKEQKIDINHLEGDVHFSRLGTYIGDLKDLPLKKTQESNSLAWFGNNHPNPFSGETKIEYKIFEPCQVYLTILSSTGMEVRELVNAIQQPGLYKVKFDATFLSEGIWLCRLEAVNNELRFGQTHKMVILK